MKRISEFKKMRVTNGLTQEEVAEFFGVSQQYISKIESNMNLSEEKQKSLIDKLNEVIKEVE